MFEHLNLPFHSELFGPLFVAFVIVIIVSGNFPLNCFLIGVVVFALLSQQSLAVLRVISFHVSANLVRMCGSPTTPIFLSALLTNALANARILVLITEPFNRQYLVTRHTLFGHAAIIPEFL